MFITTFYPRCEGFEPLNMHNCQHPYCFPADQMYRFSQEFSLFHCSELFGILRLTFLSRTISSSSKTSFLFAKLFSVKDYLMFTAKVSDSIDINFISLPHFLCFFFFLVFTNTNWKGKLCWEAFRTAASHVRVWLSTFSL